MKVDFKRLRSLFDFFEEAIVMFWVLRGRSLFIFWEEAIVLF
jgi:hypothetical protein